MDLRQAAHNLKLVERNRDWLCAPIPVREKLRYYGSMFAAYSRLVAHGGHHVTYLGRTFRFDHPATPLNLQVYPYEVGVKILGRMTVTPKHVLDIGANIGQFACTLSYLVADCEIDSVEPNPAILELLRANATENMRIHNYAIGPSSGSAIMYYEPNRSAIGSFVRANAGAKERLLEVTAQTEDDVTRITSRNAYDLVKVDVEGFEYQVLHGLRGVRTKYLFLEASGTGRERDYTDAKLYGAIAGTLGDFNVRYSSGLSGSSATYELLLEFV